MREHSEFASLVSARAILHTKPVLASLKTDFSPLNEQPFFDLVIKVPILHAIIFRMPRTSFSAHYHA
jgi:hypothetical protein